MKAFMSSSLCGSVQRIPDTLTIDRGKLRLESVAPARPSTLMQLYRALTAFDIGK